MIRSRFIFMGLFIFGFFSQSAAQDLLLQKAPQFSLKAMLQVPGNRSWQSCLDGKTVVVEFWATWCTPCMANLAHLNALADQFADSNVQFISITDESVPRISEFLKKRKMSGWVGIDTAQATFKSYGVNGMPATFVIDKWGIIRYSGRPEGLNEKVLQAITAGTYQPERIRIRETDAILGGFAPGDDPVFTAHFNPKKNKVLWQNTIRRSVGAFGMGYKQDNGFIGITLLSKTLPGIVAFLYELSSDHRVINRSSIADSLTWDIILERNKGYNMAKALNELNGTVWSAFSIRVKDSIVVRSVFVPHFNHINNVMDKKSIDFDKAASNSYRELKQIYDMVEDKLGTIVDYDTLAGTQYLDVFEIMSGFYKMTGTELRDWLRTQGVDLTEKEKDVAVKIICDV